MLSGEFYGSIPKCALGYFYVVPTTNGYACATNGGTPYLHTKPDAFRNRPNEHPRANANPERNFRATPTDR